MVSTGSLEIEHGDANEGVTLLKQALEVDFISIAMFYF
jgi:hypothetical protein